MSLQLVSSAHDLSLVYEQNKQLKEFAEYLYSLCYLLDRGLFRLGRASSVAAASRDPTMKCHVYKPAIGYMPPKETLSRNEELPIDGKDGYLHLLGTVWRNLYSMSEDVTAQQVIATLEILLHDLSVRLKFFEL